MEYAIVDIETTGGYASGSGITEIAIRIFDGNSVIDSYETLVKPSHNIPLYITALTGIDYEMVCDSPAFEDIAKDVFAMLQGRVFVAHNVNFDYSFLKYHLEDAGYVYAAPKLCTVRMARKIKPGLRSYSLGNLCNDLGIIIENRHRAGGDVDAAVTLFSKLLEWDNEGIIQAMLKKGSKEQQLPPNLPKEDFEALPSKPGVYYFRDSKGKVIYVGKAKDLRKRVAQHFTGHNPNPQRQNFLREIFSITHEVCGTELMAFILEALEIKRIYPKYNRALKKYDPKFGLFVYEDLQGYQRLFIGKYNKSHLPVQVFTTREGGMNKLKELTRRFGLCASLCRLSSCELCELIDKKNDLLCTANQPPEIYNEKVRQALSYLKEDMPGFYIVDKGRTGNEKSCIWVEQGNFYGMGYIDNSADINSMEDIKDSLTRYQGNHYIMQLIISFMCKYPKKVYKTNNIAIRESM
ncbi:DNA polymerase III subunit epsilon [Arachidicoccus ginsenosidimutans]|uniref:exonuclease domain-containing protein n=1 Tax=Arachidicoccus sp. BS20 TaxID=1850526 RepID=UPI0007F17FB1|nr:exonuclease domain-containing protein [Arachidicoccus sp. BS20]ANI89251.1 DNA polymerase III subunit epsilon [Arachidicoccus sp. BS20]